MHRKADTLEAIQHVWECIERTEAFKAGCAAYTSIEHVDLRIEEEERRILVGRTKATRIVVSALWTHNELTAPLLDLD